MKVIDLLNKIANGEELEPKEFNYRNDYQDGFNYFLYDKLGNMTGKDKLSILLNDEIEIIEELKKIEKITWKEKESLAGIETSKTKIEILARRTEKIKKSLNEIIDYINKGE